VRPCIGITCGSIIEEERRFTRLGLDYSGSVEEAGGVPLVLPIPYRIGHGPAREAEAIAASLAADSLVTIDGLLVSGGGDLDPDLFGEGPIPALRKIEPPRDHFELALVRAALARGLPVFGICRGLQVLAVVAGGALYQDLPSQRPGCLKHVQEAPRDARTHWVEVEPDTLLAERLGAGPLKVNSFHHQAISRMPQGYRVSAVSPDGVIEAIELAGMGQAPGASADPTGRESGYAFGVQWHPEDLWATEPVFLKLFVGLVEAAARYRKR
jgi:putative glutamine amidotransferase